MNFIPYFTQYTKIHLQWMRNLSVKAKNIKVLEENTEDGGRQNDTPCKDAHILIPGIMNMAKGTLQMQLRNLKQGDYSGLSRRVQCNTRVFLRKREAEESESEKR